MKFLLGEIGCVFVTSSRPVELNGFECSVNEFCVDNSKLSTCVTTGNVFEILASPVQG
jgi:hypothetical protein